MDSDQEAKENTPSRDYANKSIQAAQNARTAKRAISTVKNAEKVAQAAQKVQAVGTFIVATWEFWLIVLVIIVIVALFLVIITTIMGSSNGALPSPQPGPPPAQTPSEVVYCQGREKWSSQAYNDGNIAKTGCVPTSMAMVLSSYGGTIYDPGQIATMFHNNGWDYGPGSGQKGTNPWRITSAWLNSMGFQRAQADVVNSSKSPVYLDTKQLQLIKNYTDAGWLLLAAVDGHNLPTHVNGPHEVVIEDFDPQTNIITVRDPNSPNCRSGKPVSFNVSNIRWYLIIPVKIKSI
jgi:hypothetical protein